MLNEGTSAVYIYMREHCIINFRIELLEPWPCNTVEELLVREQHWKDKLNPKFTLPVIQSPVVFPKNPASWMPCELVKCIWKTCPPDSISTPNESGFL